MFDISGKVALVTGGVSGIGLSIVKRLLKDEIKGVAVVDINVELGNNIVKQLQNEFGRNKIIFIQADVSDKNQYEDAFKETVEIFKNLDILVNNAGITLESDWEKVIAVNLTGTVTGTILGFEKYLPKYKSGDEAVIVNIGSIASVDPILLAPTYSATKYGVLGLTRSFGSELHYNRKRIKVIAICPSYTNTPLNVHNEKTFLNSEHLGLFQYNDIPNFQSTASVANATVLKIKEAETGTAWVIENDDELYQLHFPSRSELKI